MALRHDSSRLQDPRLKAIVILADDFLYGLSVIDRMIFLQELRNGWCEQCGHTESQVCKDGNCRDFYGREA